MTGMEMTEDNWGERSLAARKRRRAGIRGAMVLAGVAFGVFSPRFVPAGPGGDVAKLWLSLVYMAVIAAGAWLLWRRTDEIERRMAVNSFAAMGFTSLFATMIVMLAAPVFGIRNPTMTIYAICLAVGGITHLLQRLRR